MGVDTTGIARFKLIIIWSDDDGCIQDWCIRDAEDLENEESKVGVLSRAGKIYLDGDCQSCVC